MTTDITVHVISYTSMEAEAMGPRTKTITNQPATKGRPG